MSRFSVVALIGIAMLSVVHGQSFRSAHVNKHVAGEDSESLRSHDETDQWVSSGTLNFVQKSTVDRQLNEEACRRIKDFMSCIRTSCTWTRRQGCTAHPYVRTEPPTPNPTPAPSKTPSFRPSAAPTLSNANSDDCLNLPDADT
eukprot:13927529-Ditylum_brightwellii.AAC.1